MKWIKRGKRKLSKNARRQIDVWQKYRGPVQSYIAQKIGFNVCSFENFEFVSSGSGVLIDRKGTAYWQLSWFERLQIKPFMHQIHPGSSEGSIKTHFQNSYQYPKYPNEGSLTAVALPFKAIYILYFGSHASLAYTRATVVESIIWPYSLGPFAQNQINLWTLNFVCSNFHLNFVLKISLW